MKSFKVRLITGLMSAAVAAGSVSLPAMAAVEISEAAAEMSAEAESSGDIAEAGSSLLLSSVGTNAVSNVLGQDVIADTGKTNSVAVASSPETVSVRSEASEDGAVVGRMKGPRRRSRLKERSSGRRRISQMPKPQLLSSKERRRNSAD
ncbi:MAG: hypothetical protein IIU47_07830, partial [Lachnospiraceae bacterium]|nr:hypothetical protein [Lachnospiraceae bacterium]